MKNFIVTIILIASSCQVFAQPNIFPENGPVGIGTTNPVKKLEVNGDVLTRGILYQKTSDGQGSGAHGISWYDPAYTTWYNYMAPAGSSNAPSGTAAPSDEVSNVTQWALRSNIENASGYGWTFESGYNGIGNAPTVKFAISSNTGNFHSTGNGIIDGNVGIGAINPVKKLEVNGDVLNRGILYQKTSDGQGSGAHGISWYDPAYTTWYSYMAPAGASNAPSGTAAPNDAASGVTSWALRSNIENASGYGWTFESGLNGVGNAPSVKFSISSNTGNFHSIGNGIIDGNVGIGTTDTRNYKLAVNGNIRAKEIKVETAPWPDYVFNSSYKLPDLKDTEQFIKEHQRLPEIPSATEVEKDGINLGEMNAKLLKKIEELTLHLIEQNKRIENLENQRK